MSEQLTNTTPAEDTASLEAVEKAAQALASEFHEDWRKTRQQEDGSFKPRVKPTSDADWIESHGTDQVDIANTEYKELPADWQAENYEAATVVVGVIAENNGNVDLSDENVRNQVGSTIHDAWLSRNEWAKGGELDVPFDQLPANEQAKDISQIEVAHRLFAIEEAEEKPSNQLDVNGSRELIEETKDTHFVETAPTLQEMISNDSRDTKIVVRRFTDEGFEYEEHTEREALIDLELFLNNAIEQTQDPDDDPSQKEMHDKAQAILDSLTFLGEKEINIALSAISESWKSYLRDDPGRQIYVYTGVENVYKYDDVIPDEPPVKSDRYLFDKLLGTFSDEELEEFSGRLVTDATALHAKEDNTRVIVFDDWSVSGRQLISSVGRVRDELGETYRDRVEVQLLTATEAQITHLESVHKANVQAYFKAHDVNTNHEKIVVAGLHSCADYGFSVDIQDIAYHLLKRTPGYIYNPADFSTLAPTLITTAVSPYRSMKQSELGNIERLKAASSKVTRLS